MSKWRIDAELLIDGENEPIKDGSVVFEGKKIIYAGTVENAPTAEIEKQTKVVMPGMWDCHVHVFGIKGANPVEWMQANLNPISPAARAAYDMKAAMEAGFTSVREAGGFGLHMKEAVNDGSIIGPNIYASGGAIGITGGHADSHSLPMNIIHQIDVQNWGGKKIVDGPLEAIKAVRLMIREGADVIKIMASGGVMSARTNPNHQEFNDEEFKAIVKEATSKGRLVMAHAHGKPGIMGAVKAGVKTIEHGTWSDEEVCELMIEKEAILVPTVYIQRRLAERGREAGATEETMVKIAMVVDEHREAMKRAQKMGVKIALGTDIFSSGADSIVPWGDHGKELEYMVEIGMSPLEAIISATSMGPKTLGQMAPKAGILREGYDADLLTLKVNPLEDITIFQEFDNITGVFKGGKLEINKGIQ